MVKRKFQIDCNCFFLIIWFDLVNVLHNDNDEEHVALSTYINTATTLPLPMTSNKLLVYLTLNLCNTNHKQQLRQQIATIYNAKLEQAAKLIFGFGKNKYFPRKIMCLKQQVNTQILVWVATYKLICSYPCLWSESAVAQWWTTFC